MIILLYDVIYDVIRSLISITHERFITVHTRRKSVTTVVQLQIEILEIR